MLAIVDASSERDYVETAAGADGGQGAGVPRPGGKTPKLDQFTIDLTGRAKAAFVAVEFDEYGAGEGPRLHQQLFADLLAAAGLDSTYLGYLDAVPAETLAVVNLMSLFGLHRRLRGAAIGHFASTEITSPPGSRRMVQALERMDAPLECIASLGIWLSVLNKTTLRANLAAVLCMLMIAAGPWLVMNYVEWLSPYGPRVADLSNTVTTALMPPVAWVRSAVTWGDYEKFPEETKDAVLLGALAYASLSWLLWKDACRRFGREKLGKN